MSIYLVEQKQEEERTVLYEFHRNSDGSKEIKKIQKFLPYFYVDENAPINGWDNVFAIENGYTSIEKTKVKKVFVNNALNIKPLRQKIESTGYKVWEADLPFVRRYLIDTPAQEKVNLKVCHLDIECNMDKNAPNIDTADQEIICITTKIGQNITTWLLSDTNIDGVKCFKQEKDLLNDFIGHIVKESPDIITAWNLHNFDLPYIINRCIRLDINYTRLSPLQEVNIREYKDEKYVTIKGIVCLDLLKAYKLWRKYGNMPQLKSYSLAFVSKNMLKEDKIKLEKSINWVWKNDIEKLVEYNRWDVELLDKIDNRFKIINFFDRNRINCHINFDDVYRTTAMLDGYIINRLNKRVILPTATKHEEDDFEGAFVMEPKKGLYRDVVVIDVSGMYPAIIRTYNISYETVGGKDIILPTGQTFSSEKGIIPTLIEEILNNRNKAKKLRDLATTEEEKELYEQQQWSEKILANSMYGYLGYTGSRFYKKEVAESITGMGVHIIKKIMEWVTNNGNQVIYADTDSNYILAKSHIPYEVVLEGKAISELVNKNLEAFSKEISGKNYIFVEFEKAIKTILFTSAKKRYAYYTLWSAKKHFFVGKTIEIQGMDSKRSDSSTLARNTQLDVLKMILDGKSKNEVYEYLKDINTKMKNRVFSDEDIGFPKGITKPLEEYYPPGPTIKGCIYSNKYFNTSFGRGSKPKFVWVKYVKNLPNILNLNMTKKNGTQITKEYKVEAISYDTKIPEEILIDWKKMSDSTFKAKLESLFDAVGWDWQELDIVGLNSFMAVKKC